MNFVMLLFERETSKFQLALLGCYINLCAGFNDYLVGVPACTDSSPSSASLSPSLSPPPFPTSPPSSPLPLPDAVLEARHALRGRQRWAG